MAMAPVVRQAIRDKFTSGGGTRVMRDAFLYLDGSSHEFAQCGRCWLYVEGKRRCAVLGSQLDVDAADSCGYFGPGPRNPDQQIIKRFTPEEVGFVRHKVRCENCKFSRDHVCGLYQALNATMPAKFNLDTRIKPTGCCNAQTPGVG
jgi:hypothetical protein